MRPDAVHLHGVQADPRMKWNEKAKVYRMKAKYTQVVSLSELLALPVHAKVVPKIYLSTLDTLIVEQYRTLWNYSSQFFVDRAPDDPLRIAIEHLADCRPMQCIGLTHIDLLNLQVSCLVERCGCPKGAVLWMRAFVTAELAKYRKRLLTWTKILNAVFFPLITATMPTLIYLQDALPHTYAITFDIQFEYGHFLLPQWYSDLLVFQFGDEYYKVKTAPTGQAHLPAVGQALIGSLLTRAIQNATTASTTISEQSWHDSGYIDNGRVCSSQPLLQVARSLVELCSKYNLKLNETPEALYEMATTPHPVYEFLSVVYDHGKQQVRLSERSKQKLLAAQDELVSTDLTVDRLRRIFSLLVWGSGVLHFELCRVYYAIKFVRRRLASTKNMNDKANVWPCTLPEWKHWFSALLDGVYTRPAHGVNLKRAALFTDASKYGFGFVLFYNGHVQSWGGRWPQHYAAWPIVELEALALLLALRLLRLDESNIHFDMFVDNTSVIGVLHKRRSPSYFLNLIVVALSDLLRSKNWVIRNVQYVTSETNIADPPSRGDVDGWIERMRIHEHELRRIFQPEQYINSADWEDDWAI